MAVDFVDLRRKMVDNQVRTVDVTDREVLAALLHVPREDFVPAERRDFAYLDSDIVLNEAEQNNSSRSLMRPAALARLLQLAQIGKRDKILAIGVTTGYSAAILGHLAGSVVALECNTALSHQAEKILQVQDVANVKVVCGLLEEGYAPASPYDVILCEGAADFVPPCLFVQLRENGRLVIVEGHGLVGEAKLYIKEKAGLSVHRAFNLALPALPGFQQAPAFVF